MIHRQFCMITAILLLAASAGSAQEAPASAPPAPRQDHAIAAAKLADDAVRAAERSWDQQMEALDKAIAALPQGRLDLGGEAVVISEMKSYVGRLLKHGQAIVESYDRMEKTASALRDELKDAPEAFRNAAAKCRSYADSAVHSDIKEDYLLLAATWEGKAGLAQKRSDAMGDLFDRKMRDYIGEANLFLERLLGMLDTLSFQEASEYDRFQTRIQQYIEKFEHLRKSFRAWHDKSLGEAEAFSPEIRERARAKRQEEDRRLLAEQARRRLDDYLARSAIRLDFDGNANMALIDATLDRVRPHFRQSQDTTVYRRAGSTIVPVSTIRVTYAEPDPKLYFAEFRPGEVKDGDFLLIPGTLPEGITLARPAAAPARLASR